MRQYKGHFIHIRAHSSIPSPGTAAKWARSLSATGHEACSATSSPQLPLRTAPSATMNNGHASSSEASSSSLSPRVQAPRPPHPSSDDDDDQRDLLGDNPLHDDLDESLSFKRKQKRPSIFSFAQFTGRRSTPAHPPSNVAPAANAPAHGASHGASLPDHAGASPPRRRMGSLLVPGAKDGMPMDWYIEGPGRRVGYEDLTAIDWIFEYTKERTRLRVLRSNARGIIGYFQLAFDNSQEWIILLSTGIMVGTVAAVIDIVTDWLGDLKTGYCTTAEGGAFYLNRAFCCLGYDEGAQCMGWRPWASALGVSSAVGKWIIEYFLFIIFSVRLPLSPRLQCATVLTPSRSPLPFAQALWSKSMPCTPSTVVYPKSRPFWVASSYGGFWEPGP